MADKNFASELMAELKAYTEDVQEGLEKAKTDIAKESVKLLKRGGGFKNKTGRYNKGWAIKKDKKTINVWNAKAWYLTHLLEAGHASRNGKRVRGYTHIEPVYDWARDKFESEVRKRI
ncbi:HK97 gp10 family phage protein [Weissella confusa]|uniref:hypothetical protein n=1 Tax=Weissella confusa TaxID=1583 RepID=UPI0018F13818|nr:hypothetical protein [Weissella confusa]MBJ7680645.1 HK97 gp10 family phage protein [Weissella confusa]